MPIRRRPRPRRNQLCPCGSGRKFKVCCLRPRRPTAAAIAAAILAQAPLPNAEFMRRAQEDIRAGRVKSIELIIETLPPATSH